LPDLTWLLIAAAIALVMWLPMRKGRVDAATAARLLRHGALLVDVRSHAEFAATRLQGAVHVPLAECLRAPPAALPRDRPLVVYCASGARSALAARALRRHGWPEVSDLGSLRRWPERIERSADSADTGSAEAAQDVDLS
jgi:phage shock protein E